MNKFTALKQSLWIKNFLNFVKLAQAQNLRENFNCWLPHMGDISVIYPVELFIISLKRFAYELYENQIRWNLGKYAKNIRLFENSLVWKSDWDNCYTHIGTVSFQRGHFKIEIWHRNDVSCLNTCPWWQCHVLWPMNSSERITTLHLIYVYALETRKNVTLSLRSHS